MSVSPLSAFTLQSAQTIVALGVPNVFALPAGSAPTTLLVTNQGPEAAQIALTTASATTTATQATVGATTIVVASATGIAVGQIAIGVGIPVGISIPAGYISYLNGQQATTVIGINGTTVTLSNGITSALSSTTVNFVTPLTPGTGLTVLPITGPIPLVIGSNTFFQAYCINSQSKAQLNLAVGV